jgi:hypothetical protein
VTSSGSESPRFELFERARLRVQQVSPAPRAVVLTDDAAMGPGWGGTVGNARAKSLKPAVAAEPKPLLVGHFRVSPWRFVTPLARPVTPEVGSPLPRLLAK